MKNLIVLILLITSTNLLAKDNRLSELVIDYQTAKSEYGEFSSQSLRKQRKVQIYSQAKFILFSIKGKCADEIKLRCGSNLKSDRQIVSCLDADRSALSDSCDMELSSFIGSQYFDESFEHNGIKISKGSYFFYQPMNSNMKIVAAVLTKGFRYENVDYKNGRVDFNINGLASANLAHDQVIGGVLYSSDLLAIFFHVNGKVKSGVLAEDTKFGDYIYKASTQITLDEKGNVVMGVLGKDYVILGKNYTGGDFISF
ncbi:hypothetical protein [Aliivibrio logei]|uniref:Uncharacterized protein n=1 Tax=Aliivibrio logei 5S-186 TaxID=626086 RepID=A0ABX3AXY3_ALILO|nr:hypothetical protein [Aliivibrio logei]OEF18979.1 hypothetical protein A1Q5_18690 [Aliivibrio logei 5S-186]